MTTALRTSQRLRCIDLCTPAVDVVAAVLGEESVGGVKVVVVEDPEFGILFPLD